MFKNKNFRLFVIAAVVALSIWLFYPPSEKLKEGLDIKGGMHLVLEVKTDKVIATELEQGADRAKRLLIEKKFAFDTVRRKDMAIQVIGIADNQVNDVKSLLKDFFPNFDMPSKVENGKTNFFLSMTSGQLVELEKNTVQQARDTLERRIDEFGVAEPTFQLYGSSSRGVENQIIVELPGVEDPEGVKALLKETAALELRLVEPGAPFGVSRDAIMQFFGGKLPDGVDMVRFKGEGSTPGSESWIAVKTAPIITGRHLTSAKPSQDTSVGISKPAVSFSLNSEGAMRFGDATAANVGRQIAIVLDNKAISAPRVNSKITDSGIITGLASEEEANRLSISLRSGALPADITILEERNVGPSLGRESVQSGLFGGIAGVVLILIFMLVYYKTSAVNAMVCLAINLVILLGAMAYFGATLTLPGIAGIILTIGMGVDSNVLIFERIREELRHGKAIPSAVDAGFSRAGWTIIDTHVTSLIASVFLYQFGTGPIRGFAVTLAIGLIANLFASIFCSRTLFHIITHDRTAKKLSI